MKVLIIQPKIGMGDMIIYLPYIHAISKSFNKPVSVLAKDNSRASELLAEDSHIDEIILLDRNKDKSGTHDGFKGFFNLVEKIKSKKFDKVFIFSSSLRYFLVSKLAKIKNISQYPLFKKKDNIVTSAKIFTENELNSIVSTQPNLIISNNKIKELKKKISANHKYICLGVSASGPTKRWDVQNYINLCKSINNVMPSKFYIAGGNNDRDIIDKILKSEIGPLCESFSSLKISETLPLIKNCNLYIGNDTGWLHIASALGIKCLAIFMDSPVKAYGKYSDNISVIIPEGETEETTTHNTMGKDKISFNDVYNNAIRILG